MSKNNMTADQENAKVAAMAKWEKAMKDAAEIGTSARASVKLEAVEKAMETMKANAPALALVEVYKAANTKPISDKIMKDYHPGQTGYDDYKAALLTLYTATAKYAESTQGGGESAIKTARQRLYEEWKHYLSMFEFTPSIEGASAMGPRCSSNDVAVLFAAIKKVVREGTVYTAKTNDEGEVYAKLVKGVAHTAITSMSAFAKEVERAACERYFNLDGVMSRDVSKAAFEAIKAMKESTIAEAAPETVVSEVA